MFEQHIRGKTFFMSSLEVRKSGIVTVLINSRDLASVAHVLLWTVMYMDTRESGQSKI